ALPISKYIKIVYVIQGEDMLKNRQLYGVGYALWISSKLINNNFLVINGDDYYSSNSIEIATKALSNCNVENNHFMLGYKLKNTLFEESNNINRGICKISDNKILFIDIATRIKIKNNITTGYLKSKSKQFSGDEITCMNFYGFKKNILDELDKHVNNQLNLNNEITIHDMINLLISENKIILTSINLEDKCLGLTNIDD